MTKDKTAQLAQMMTDYLDTWVTSDRLNIHSLTKLTSNEMQTGAKAVGYCIVNQIGKSLSYKIIGESIKGEVKPDGVLTDDELETQFIARVKLGAQFMATAVKIGRLAFIDVESEYETRSGERRIRTIKAPIPTKDSVLYGSVMPQPTDHELLSVPYPDYDLKAGLNQDGQSIFLRQPATPAVEQSEIVIKGVNAAMQMPYDFSRSIELLEIAMKTMHRNAWRIDSEQRKKCKRNADYASSDDVTASFKLVELNHAIPFKGTPCQWSYACREIRLNGAAYLRLGIDHRGRQYGVSGAGFSHFDSGLMAILTENLETAEKVLQKACKGQKRVTRTSLLAGARKLIDGDWRGALAFYKTSEREATKTVLVPCKKFVGPQLEREPVMTGEHVATVYRRCENNMSAIAAAVAVLAQEEINA